MLPEAVRVLNALIEKGNTVYIHCTAGINRAPLTALGYMTFVKGFTMTKAYNHIKGLRTVANPYLESWKTARMSLLAGKEEQVRQLSREIYERRLKASMS